MPRKARVIAPGYLYHVTQRGNNRQYVFSEDNDYILYLKRIEASSKECGVKVYAYCLMGNHVHFIVEPQHKDSLARMFRVVNMRYAQYFQKKTSGSGHVWQGRYYSCLLQGSHVKDAIRYVELNPVRAKIVKEAWEYPWSSARAHLGKKYRWITLANTKEIVTVGNWKNYLNLDEDENFLKNIRNATKKNLALGLKEFMLNLEKKLGRKILPNPMGRPKKVGNSKK